MLISSHLLSDLERVVTHVAFMREGRLQLLDAWDAMQEHLRLLPPAVLAGQPTLPAHAVIWTNRQSGQQIVDTRLAPAHSTSGRALLLDELFLELNT